MGDRERRLTGFPRAVYGGYGNTRRWNLTSGPREALIMDNIIYV
jgi:hypothetical protein